jgi:hypothetical protein
MATDDHTRRTTCPHGIALADTCDTCIRSCLSADMFAPVARSVIVDDEPYLNGRRVPAIPFGRARAVVGLVVPDGVPRGYVPPDVPPDVTPIRAPADPEMGRLIGELQPFATPESIGARARRLLAWVRSVGAVEIDPGVAVDIIAVATGLLAKLERDGG